MARKTLTLNLGVFLTLRSLSFSVTTKIEHPFSIIRMQVYHFNCRRCCASYVQKTQRTFHERYIEHAWSDKDSAVRSYVSECNGIKHIKNLMLFNTSLDGDVTTLDHRDININIVNNNVRIIDSHRNWNLLLYKGEIEIEQLKQLLKKGLKASKELYLF